MVQDPFNDITIHIVEAPGIRLLLAHLLIFEITVLLEPGVLAELARIISEEIAVGCAGATSVFPFGFGR